MASFNNLLNIQRNALYISKLKSYIPKQTLTSIKRFCHNETSSLSTASPTNKITSISLSQSVPWLEEPTYATPGGDHHEARVTRLSNGLQVATQAKFGMFCTVGVLIDSGSRYETEHKSGISHFLEKLAFSSTEKYSDKDVILQKLERHGGICDCQGSRDTLIYAVSAAVDGLAEVTELLSEVTLKPRITDDEVDNMRQAILFELESLSMRPDPEPLLVELIHEAAYQNSTLGLPKICPLDNIQQIDRHTILKYLQRFHTPDRMVLAGVGVDHDEFVRLADEHFMGEAVWGSEVGAEKVHSTPALYTGGSKEIIKDLSSVSLGPTPMPELAHLVLGFESCSHKHEDFVAVCVLNMMMGGGGSFSAGGPGKGMYSRLYLNILNEHHWIHNATAFNHAYNDTGLFCVHASTHPNSLKELTEVITKELVNMRNHDVSSVELERAKKQLKSMLLMNLEARPVVFEDIGRQVLAHGKRMTSQHYCNLIEKVTENDIHRVAYKMLNTAPSVAALGDLHELPPYQHVKASITQQLSNTHTNASRIISSLFRSS